VKYRKGLKRSLKNQFGAWFTRLDELLDTLSATLPHTRPSEWYRVEDTDSSGASLKGHAGNKILNITLSYSVDDSRTFQLRSELKKGRAFGVYEREFAHCLAREIGRVVNVMAQAESDALVVGAGDVLDAAIADFLRTITNLKGPNFLEILRYLKELAQQSYETKQISYGLIVSPRSESKDNEAHFPEDVANQKRFQALTDGYKTAILLDRTGKVVRLVGLNLQNQLGKHFRPVWIDPLADSARSEEGLGIALTRTGAILVAWQGNLLLSYRAGKWTLWSHNENVEIVREGLRRRGRKPKDIARLAARLYRCALDISFRRSGGLLVALRSPMHLSKLVRRPEQLHGNRRTIGDRALGEWLETNTIVGIDREVLSDLTAVVCDRAGKLLSYGAVLLLPKKSGIARIEGSRSRAAHSASFYGLSIKISSDGGIDVIESGEKLLSL
jgi:hypothetical protein